MIEVKIVPRKSQVTNESGERLTYSLFCFGAGSSCYCLQAVLFLGLDFVVVCKVRAA